MLYTIALLVVLFSINYFSYLVNPPNGMHLWRQADSGSFVAYYYENGMNFLKPGTYNLTAEEGRTASEFPILYYITAALWHLFGRSDATLKILNSIIVFTGFFFLFKIAHKQIGNIYIALLTTLLLLSSATLLSYSNSYLPDPPALSLSFIGAWLFFKFTENGRYKYYLWAFVLFTLATLIKISMGFFPIAVLGLFIIERVLKIKLGSTKIFIGNAFKYIIPAICMMATVGLWVLWVIQYNKANHSEIFLTNILPYWKCTAQDLKIIHEHVSVFWLPFYYYFSTLHLFIVLGILGLVALKKWNKLNAWFTLFAVLGNISYMLLFYKQFGMHDYYMIPMLLPVAFIVIFSIAAIYRTLQNFKKIATPIFIIALLVINVLSYLFAKKRLFTHKEKDGFYYQNIHPDMLSGKMEQYGIPKNSAIFSFPDDTPNVTLYYFQRKGYTCWRHNETKDMPENLKNYVGRKGVRYLVVTNYEYYPFVESDWYDTQLLGEFEQIRTYKVFNVDTTKWTR